MLEDPVCAEPKLFVGGLRFEVTREDVFSQFSHYGPIKNCVLLKHQDSGKSKGCAMVSFTKWAHAEAAVNAENGTQSHLSGPRPLIVKFADPQRRQEDGVLVGVTPKKLFVGQVAKGVTADQIKGIFNPYGEIVDLNVMPPKKDGAMGCAFVTYSTWAAAEQAIEGVDGKFTLPGASNAIAVKFADAKPQDIQRIGGKRGMMEMMGGIGSANKRQFVGQGMGYTAKGGGATGMGGMQGYGMGNMMAMGGMGGMGMMPSMMGMGYGMGGMGGMGMGGMGMGGMGMQNMANMMGMGNYGMGNMANVQGMQGMGGGMGTGMGGNMGQNSQSGMGGSSGMAGMGSSMGGGQSGGMGGQGNMGPQGGMGQGGDGSGYGTDGSGYGANGSSGMGMGGAGGDSTGGSGMMQQNAGGMGGMGGIGGMGGMSGASGGMANQMGMASQGMMQGQGTGGYGMQQGGGMGGMSGMAGMGGMGGGVMAGGAMSGAGNMAVPQALPNGALGMGNAGGNLQAAKAWKLFIGQISFALTEQDLYPFFAQFGTILELALLRNNDGRHRGCGFLIYSSQQEAEAAIASANGAVLPNDFKGRPLMVKYANQKMQQ